MKKILLTAAIAGLTALPVSADLLFGGDVSYSYFVPDTEYTTSGGAKYKSSEGHPTSLQASIEHPIPLIPNIKIRYIDSETTELNTDVTYKYESTDLILYYELLDTGILSFDAGLSVSDISNDITNLKKYQNYVAGAYANVELGFPGTPLAVYGQAVVGFVSSDTGTTTSDIQAGIRYALFSKGVKVTLDAGYRIIDNDYDNFDGLNAKFRQDGFYGGATLDF